MVYKKNILKQSDDSTNNNVGEMNEEGLEFGSPNWTRTSDPGILFNVFNVAFKNVYTAR